MTKIILILNFLGKMKNLDLNVSGVQEMNAEEMLTFDGGVVFGFNWGMFWSGCKIGLGVGGATAIAVYA